MATGSRSAGLARRALAALTIVWALAALLLQRRGLAAGPPLRPFRLGGAGRLPAGGRPLVQRAVVRVGATCLQRCVVLQTWDLAHGVDRSVVIGVRLGDGGGGGEEGFGAHAWLDHEAPPAGEGFVALARLLPTNELEGVVAPT